MATEQRSKKRGYLIAAVVCVLALVAYYFLSWDSFDPAELRDRRVLITGASSGLGESLAYAYARHGARLILTARRGKLLEAVARRCLELGASATHVVVADAAVADDRAELVRQAQKLLGGIDDLILNHATLRCCERWNNSAGSQEVLKSDHEVNFLAHVHLASLAMPMLVKSRGRIGVMSSVASKMGVYGHVQYASSKWALTGFFSALRQELYVHDVPVSITLCILGLLDTARAIEMVSHYNSNFNMGILDRTEDAADAVIRAVATRAFEVYYPRRVWLLAILNSLLPDTTSKVTGTLIAKSLNITPRNQQVQEEASGADTAAEP